MDNEQGVTIRRLDVPFWHLVGFLIKLGIAAVPATIVMAVIWVVTVTVVTSTLRDIGQSLRTATSDVTAPRAVDRRAANVSCQSECVQRYGSDAGGTAAGDVASLKRCYDECRRRSGLPTSAQPDPRVPPPA